MLSWLRNTLTNLYLCINISENVCKLHGEFVKNKSVVKTIRKDFEIKNGKVDRLFNTYLQEQSKKAHFSYLSYLLHTERQWALPTNKTPSDFNVDAKNSFVIRMPNNWSIFIPNYELNDISVFLNNISLDLAYSPFSLLYEQILQHQQKDKNTLYIYFQDDCVSVLIFKNQTMRFGMFFENTLKIAQIKDTLLDPVDTTDIDTLIANEEEKMESFGILDDFDNIELEQKEDFSDIQNIEDTDEDEEIDLETSVTIMGKVARLLDNIHESLQDYYSNPLYDSDFIDSIVIFDGVGIDINMTEGIKNEFLIEPLIFPINVSEDILKLVKRDLR